jgi:polyphosphate kinase 2 (PPK2 family)
MGPDKLVKNARQLAAPFRDTTGKTFGLKDCELGDTLRFDKKDENRAKEALAQGVQTLPLLQDKLYAQDQRAMLLIFQAMDAAGQDAAKKELIDEK